ncbi:MAG: glycosyltransferase family 2 protein [Arcobacteraceae bacterium]|nr:glycosyltransferase family 2 protein [Arcobacteraceae bacterium]
MSKQDTIVVVPTFNNPKTIKNVVDDILDNNYNVIVVDDGSISKVVDILNEEKYKSIHIETHPHNIGKGQAILTGANKAKQLGYKNIVSMDGDGQHLASEVIKLIEKNTLVNQIIIGSRNFNIDNIPKKSKIGRAFHNFWIRLNSGYDIEDSLSGFRLYPVSIIDLGTTKVGFSFEIEVIVKHIWKHKHITQTIIECFYPKPEDRVSHFDNYRDTTRFILLHLKLFFLKILK